MKKIFALAIALLAVANIATAQVNGDYVMNVTDVNGNLTQFGTDEVAEITFAANPWKSYEGTYYYEYIFQYAGSEETVLWLDDVDGLGIVKDYPTTGYDYNFTYDAASGSMNVPEQDTGWYCSATSGRTTYYGDMYVCETNDWLTEYGSLFSAYGFPESTEYVSHYDATENKYNFAVCWYMITTSNSILLFDFVGDDDVDYEYFVPSGTAGAPAKNKVQSEGAVKNFQVREPIAVATIVK